MSEVKPIGCKEAHWHGIEDGLGDCVSREHSYEDNRERWSYVKGFREGLRQRQELLARGITNF